MSKSTVNVGRFGHLSAPAENLPVGLASLVALTGRVAGRASLTAAELAICAATGIAPEQFEESKKKKAGLRPGGAAAKPVDESEEPEDESEEPVEPEPKADANPYGLSESELAMCEKLGIKPEAFAKAKKDAAAKQAQRDA